MGRCRGRRPKASEERTRGKRRVVCRLWGFCGAAAIVKGFGCRPYVIDGPVQRPASESLRRTNPREAASGVPSMGILWGSGYREGFRMPALRDRWAGAEAGVRKPPKNEPAGSGEWCAVYGDFVGQRLS